MKRNPFVWILSAVAMVVVAYVTFWLGQTLLPPYARAVTVGTIVPWFLTWGMIWLTVITSLIIAANLFIVGSGGGERSVPALLPPTPRA